MKRILFYLSIVLLCALLLYVLGKRAQRAKNDEHLIRRIHYIGLFLFLFYIFSVLYITIFSRTVQYRKPYLDPFWRLYLAFAVQNGRITIRWYQLNDATLNIIMFIPFGFFIPWCIKRLQNHSFLIVGLGFICSSLIELTQHYTLRGSFETSDILCNTIGCFIGVCIYKFLLKNVVEE